MTKRVGVFIFFFFFFLRSERPEGGGPEGGGDMKNFGKNVFASATPLKSVCERVKVNSKYDELVSFGLPSNPRCQ